MNFIRLKYGKYLNKIDQEIPQEHIVLEESSDLSKSVEPGEVNLPTGESYSITLANLDQTGQQRYPFNFWQNQSRTQGEGATQLLQIYFQIFVNEKPSFLGILKRVRYNKYQSLCTLELSDLTEMLRIEERQMMRSFQFEIPRPPARSDDEGERKVFIDPPNMGRNDLPELKDLSGNTIPQRSLSFQLFVSPWTGTQSPGNFSSVNRDGSKRFPFAWHLGWQELDYVTPVGSNDGLVLAEQDFPRYIQIGDMTIFTRCKLQVIQVRNSAGSRSRQELWCTLWENGTEPSAGIIPVGKYLWDGQIITEATEGMEVIFHEPSFGTETDVALDVGNLPVDKKFIFGLPYTESGSNIVLTSAEYAYFDVVKKITDIISTDVSIRHTDTGVEGKINITAFNPEVALGTFAEGFLACESVSTSETLIVSLVKGSTSYQSAEFNVATNDTTTTVIEKARDAINFGQSGQAWLASINQTPNLAPDELTVQSMGTGEEWNGYEFQVFRIQNGNTSFPYSNWSSIGTSGGSGSDEFQSEPIDLLVAGSVFSTSSNIQETDTLEAIAQKIFDSAVAINDDDYEFILEGSSVIVRSFKSRVETIGLDVRNTNVKWNSEPMTGSFDLFDLSKLRPENRLAFYSDILMFDWIGKSVIEALVSACWQVGALMFTVGSGKISIQNRNWFEFYPNDINDPGFDALFIPQQNIEPMSGNEYDEGFMSYETTHPEDIIEINNVKSKTNVTIYSDKDGAINTPTLKNKKIKTGNFRIHDLEVRQGSSSYRYSPEDDLWPGAPMEHFLPTPRQQLNLIARTYFFPSVSKKMTVSFLNYLDMDVGGYVWDQNLNLWFIREFSLNPRTLKCQINVEFKKSIVDFYAGYSEGGNVGEHFSITDVTA